MKVLIVFVCLLSIICMNCEPIEIWGDITTTMIRGSLKSKYAIPFVIRTVRITYPDEFGLSDNVGIIRGIKHTNQLNKKDCHPEIVIVTGGLNEPMATVKITSERGCGIDSLVEFYIEDIESSESQLTTRHIRATIDMAQSNHHEVHLN